MAQDSTTRTANADTADFASPGARVSAPVRLILKRFVDRIHEGRLTLVFPDGERHVANGELNPGLAAELHVGRGRLLRRLICGGSIALGEAYMDGDWDTPDLARLLELLGRNEVHFAAKGPNTPLLLFWHRLIHCLRPNTRRGSRRNIAAHYDLGNDFYRQWLDSSMTYSAALFDGPDDTLEQAQQAKYRRILERLAPQPGERVLEIGSGWGGFATLAAREAACDVTGLTLSTEQLRHAEALAAEQGLSDKARFALCDYRDAGGTYDHIVSIEMFEAVGEKNWPEYFRIMRDRLRSGGSALIQVITISEERYDVYRAGADFIQRYIFPGGMLPSPTALAREIGRAGLEIADLHRFGGSYARTLAIWHAAFDRAWPRIAPLGYDETFRRMWKFYLGYCEGGFRADAVDVAQYHLRRP